MGGANAPRRLSGMQKQVLALYRGFLRAARSKSPDDRRSIESIVSTEFRRNARQVDRKNFLYIEYLLRRGKKQLDQLKSPGTTSISGEKGIKTKILEVDTMDNEDVEFAKENMAEEGGNGVRTIVSFSRKRTVES